MLAKSFDGNITQLLKQNYSYVLPVLVANIYNGIVIVANIFHLRENMYYYFQKLTISLRLAGIKMKNRMDCECCVVCEPTTVVVNVKLCLRSR